MPQVQISHSIDPNDLAAFYRAHSAAMATGAPVMLMIDKTGKVLIIRGPDPT